MKNKYKYVSIDDILKEEFSIANILNEKLKEKEVLELLKFSFIYIISKEDNPFTIEQVFFLKDLLNISEDDRNIKATFGKGMKKEIEKLDLKREFCKKTTGSMETCIKFLNGELSTYLDDAFKFWAIIRELKDETRENY